MGKYDHICELTGVEIYPQWKRQLTLALTGKWLWSHYSNRSDPLNLTEFAATIPTPVDLKTITTAETEQILNWLAKDTQAKAIINCKVSPIVTSQLDENLTAQEQWEILAQ